MPVAKIDELQLLYQSLNAEFFAGALPPCRIVWSRQLTRAAGNIEVRSRVIKLSVPILVDAFARNGLFAPEYSVCGVSCDNSDDAIREILKHEMIHLWLFERGVPHGHTPEFRAKANEIGQPRTRHDIALPARKSGWEYSCVHCHAKFVRRRRYGRAVACGKCCDLWSKGKFDPRFRLKGKRILSSADK